MAHVMLGPVLSQMGRRVEAKPEMRRRGRDLDPHALSHVAFRARDSPEVLESMSDQGCGPVRLLRSSR